MRQNDTIRTENNTRGWKDELALPGMQALHQAELEQVEGGFDWRDLIPLAPVILSLL